ncbi:hypothetical protein MH1LPH_23360 [Lactiplantibacillus brownii]
MLSGEIFQSVRSNGLLLSIAQPSQLLGGFPSGCDGVASGGSSWTEHVSTAGGFPA